MIIWIEVTKISYNSKVIQTYDLLSFTGKQTYFANGILAHEENPPIFPFWINYYINKFFKQYPDAFPLFQYIMGI